MFLTDEERKAKKQSGRTEKEEPPHLSSKVPQDPDPEPEGSSKTLVRASVKTRIQEINIKSASPGKFPELKQTKLMEYHREKISEGLEGQTEVGAGV